MRLMKTHSKEEWYGISQTPVFLYLLQCADGMVGNISIRQLIVTVAFIRSPGFPISIDWYGGMKIWQAPGILSVIISIWCSRVEYLSHSNANVAILFEVLRYCSGIGVFSPVFIIFLLSSTHGSYLVVCLSIVKFVKESTLQPDSKPSQTQWILQPVRRYWVTSQNHAHMFQALYEGRQWR